MTTSTPAGVRGNCSADRCRNRRRTRFRVTAGPTARPTTKPTNVPVPASLRPRWTTRVDLPTRTPDRVVRRKSPDRRILCARGNTGGWVAAGSGGQLVAALTAARGEDGATGTGPHPLAETVGTAAAPVAGLESALGHGRTPTSSLLAVFTGLPPHMAGIELQRANADSKHRSPVDSDLLTVRGGGKGVKPTPLDRPDVRPIETSMMSSRHAAVIPSICPFRLPANQTVASVAHRAHHFTVVRPAALLDPVVLPRP